MFTVSRNASTWILKLGFGPTFLFLQGCCKLIQQSCLLQAKWPQSEELLVQFSVSLFHLTGSMICSWTRWEWKTTQLWRGRQSLHCCPSSVESNANVQWLKVTTATVKLLKYYYNYYLMKIFYTSNYNKSLCDYIIIIEKHINFSINDVRVIRLLFYYHLHLLWNFRICLWKVKETVFNLCTVDATHTDCSLQVRGQWDSLTKRSQNILYSNPHLWFFFPQTTG